MRELALFAGAGGGVLGTKLLGWKVIGYVEWNEYCQQLIAQRIADGVLDRAPVFTDVREFIQSGAARQYRGFADVVTAGFPCQPFSVAGKRAGADDERNMWPATIECLRMVRPRYAFLENVPGILISGYFGTILGDLAESGYDARWRILSAAEVGAPHKRDRLWIVAIYSNSRNVYTFRKIQRGETAATGGICSHVAHAQHGRRVGRARQSGETGRAESAHGSASMDDAPSQRLEGCTGQSLQGQINGFTRSSWWATEPNVGRVADGVASRVDRLKALGNGQVPLVAATAWRLLTEVTA